MNSEVKQNQSLGEEKPAAGGTSDRNEINDQRLEGTKSRMEIRFETQAVEENQEELDLNE